MIARLLAWARDLLPRPHGVWHVPSTGSAFLELAKRHPGRVYLGPPYRAHKKSLDKAKG